MSNIEKEKDTKDSFLTLYKTYIRPHLEYCVQVWSPHLQRDKDVLEKAQRRATKIVPELVNLSYEERLHQLGLTTLEKRRTRGDLIEVYKIIRDVENISSEVFFQNRLYAGLRGHSRMLSVQRCKYDLRKYFFSNRIVVLWYSLPSHIVNAPSVNCFKNYYDAYYQTSL